MTHRTDCQRLTANVEVTRAKEDKYAPREKNQYTLVIAGSWTFDSMGQLGVFLGSRDHNGLFGSEFADELRDAVKELASFYEEGRQQL